MERTARHGRPTASRTRHAVRTFRLTVELALCFGVAAASAGSANAADDSLTAIDVLLLPGPTMIEHAKADNARLRKNYRQGFALDAEHHPHITLLQRYVRTADLEKVYGAVERVFNDRRPAGWELEATGYYYLDFNNMGLAGIVIRPTPQLRELQDAIVVAVKPYTEPNGTSAAYVTTPQSPDVNTPTLQYVNAFVPQRIGKNFNPHVTIGVGHLGFVQQMKTAPFETFKFKVDGAAVYHLGNFGTAAKQLWKWRSKSSNTTAASRPGTGDPLPSWNDVASKRAIVDFVTRVTDEGGPDFVPVDDRIATFDNDGTLWCEMPIYVQFVFGIDRVRALAPQHPDWWTRQPFKAALEDNEKELLSYGDKGFVKIIMAGHAGMTPPQFEQIVDQWISTAKHPRFHRLYTQLVYQPMLELLAYLRENEFKTFIVSGGGIEFMRAWTDRVYGIPAYQIVGSTIVTDYEVRDGQPTLIRLPEVDYVSDKKGKPIAINRFIGMRPIAAFGNSDGDYEMLRWTTAGNGPRFGLIVHHTDAKREYAYDFPSLVGQLKVALEEAPKYGWTVVNMKNDWKVIFPQVQDAP